MKEIIKIRQGIFETNSSSSHSFSMGPEGRFDSYLPISDDGVIDVPSDSWNYINKTNDPLYKLSYLLSFIWSIKSKDGYYQKSNDDSSWEKYRDFVYDVILNFTGASKINFTPSEIVDHQSIDIIDERDFRDPEFIKEFVFNPETWLYLLWDSYEPEIGFYNDQELDKTPLYIIRFDNIDEELKLYPRELNYDYSYFIDDFLSQFIYYPEDKTFVKCTKDGKYPEGGIKYSGDCRFGDLVLTPKTYPA